MFKCGRCGNKVSALRDSVIQKDVKICKVCEILEKRLPRYVKTIKKYGVI